jgi:hypothetical protein
MLDTILKYGAILCKYGNYKEGIDLFYKVIAMYEDNRKGKYLPPKYVVIPSSKIFINSSEHLFGSAMSAYMMLIESYQSINRSTAMQITQLQLQKFLITIKKNKQNFGDNFLIPGYESKSQISEGYRVKKEKLQSLGQFKNLDFKLPVDKDRSEKLVYFEDDLPPDDIVRIYYWKPYVTQSRHISLGHVSLQTSKIYASLWPEKEPTVRTGYEEKAIFHKNLDEDIQEETNSHGRLSGFPDEIEDIHGLKVDKINKFFEDFKIEKEKNGNFKWSLFSHQCGWLVLELLDVGEIKEIIPKAWAHKWKDKWSFLPKINVLMYIGVPAAILVTSNNGFWQCLLTFFITGIPVSLYFNISNRRKLHSYNFSFEDLGDIFTIVSGPFAVMSTFLLIKLWSNKIDSSPTGVLIGIASSVFLLVSTCSIMVFSGKLADLIGRCVCLGTDNLIRPSGVIQLAKLAAKVSRVSAKTREGVELLHKLLYYCLIFGALSGSFLKSDNYTNGLIFLNGNMLGGLFLYNYLSKKISERHSEEEKNIVNKIYFSEAQDDPLYSRFFALLVNMGMTWGIIISSSWLEEDSIYFPLLISAGGLVGFSSLAIAYQLTRSALRTFYYRLQETAIDAQLSVLQQTEHSSSGEDVISLSDFAVGSGSIYSASEPLLGDIQEEKRESKRGHCAIL